MEFQPHQASYRHATPAPAPYQARAPIQKRANAEGIATQRTCVLWHQPPRRRPPSGSKQSVVAERQTHRTEKIL